jgi:hypothetical protein
MYKLVRGVELNADNPAPAITPWELELYHEEFVGRRRRITLEADATTTVAVVTYPWFAQVADDTIVWNPRRDDIVNITKNNDGAEIRGERLNRRRRNVAVRCEIEGKRRPRIQFVVIVERNLYNEALRELNQTRTNIEMLEQELGNFGDFSDMIKDVNDLIGEITRIGDRNISAVERFVFDINPRLYLNATQQLLFADNRQKGTQTLTAAGLAMNQYSGGVDGDMTNAKRHAHWNAAAVVLTRDERYVKFFTDAHEYGTPEMLLMNNPGGISSYDHTRMDLHNNAIGRVIGRNAIINNRLISELPEFINAAEPIYQVLLPFPVNVP